MTEKFWTKKTVVWLGALVCCFLWGSAFPCIKIGYKWIEIAAYDTASQMYFAGIRFTIAGVLAVLLGSLIEKRFLRPTAQSLKKVIKLSMLQTVGQYTFFYIALAHTTGVKASILESMNVFAAIIIAAFLFHQEKITIKKIAGCVLGFAGVVLVNLSGSGFDATFTLKGEGFMLISTVLYAFSSVVLKIMSKDDNPVMLSGYQFILGGIIMAIIGKAFGGHFEVFPPKALMMMLWLAMVSAVAYSLWGILLKFNPVSQVAVFGFMNPVFGVLLSALLLDEASTLGIKALISLVLVCVGIYIVNSGDGQIVAKKSDEDKPQKL